MKTLFGVLLLLVGCGEPYYLVSNRAIEDARKSDIPSAQETEEIVVSAKRLHDGKEVDLRFREIKHSIQPHNAAFSYVLTSNRSMKRLGAGLLIAGGLLVLGGGVALGTAEGPESGILQMTVGLPCMVLGFAGLVSGSINLGLGFSHGAEYGR